MHRACINCTHFAGDRVSGEQDGGGKRGEERSTLPNAVTAAGFGCCQPLTNVGRSDGCGGRAREREDGGVRCCCTVAVVCVDPLCPPSLPAATLGPMGVPVS